MGIGVLQDAFTGLAPSLTDLALDHRSVTGLLGFMLIGILLTLTTQSFSAAIAITISAVMTGAAGLVPGAAVIIGANVGTTSTAIFAAIGGTASARRTALSHVLFSVIAGTSAFLVLPIYLWVSGQAVMRIGADRIKPGSVSDVIARYYADNAFLDLRSTTQTVYRGVLERFRNAFGNDPIRRFDAERISRLMNAMREKPHAAARLRKLLTQLFIIARRAKLVPFGFDPIKDTRAPKAESEGYHRWTEEELAAFEAAYPLGTKPRLALALLLYSAQRSGDVRFMTPDMIADGRIPLPLSKTSNSVDVPIVPPLREALEAGPLGERLLLETKDREAFTPKGFYGMMKKACLKAGIPHCTPHGLRKSAARRCREAGCTDDEGMAITGYRRSRNTGVMPETLQAGHVPTPR